MDQLLSLSLYWHVSFVYSSRLQHCHSNTSGLACEKNISLDAVCYNSPTSVKKPDQDQTKKPWPIHQSFLFP